MYHPDRRLSSSNLSLPLLSSPNYSFNMSDDVSMSPSPSELNMHLQIPVTGDGTGTEAQQKQQEEKQAQDEALRKETHVQGITAKFGQQSVKEKAPEMDGVKRNSITTKTSASK